MNKEELLNEFAIVSAEEKYDGTETPSEEFKLLYYKILNRMEEALPESPQRLPKGNKYNKGRHKSRKDEIKECADKNCEHCLGTGFLVTGDPCLCANKSNYKEKK
jgi:hypothetical protein